MALPSPFRAIWGYVAIAWVLGLGFAWALADSDPLGALVMGVGFPLLGSLTPLQASLRLRRVLGEFANQVPGDPEPDHSAWTDQTLTWKDPDLVVEGSTFRGCRLSNLAIHAAGSRSYRSPLRARETAREALGSLELEPTIESWADRLPSPDPVHGTVRTIGCLLLVLPGLLLFVGIFVLGALWLAVAGVGTSVLAGVFRWWTLRRARRGFEALAAGLRDGGVQTCWIDFEGGLLRLRFTVVTSRSGGSGRSTDPVRSPDRTR
jgi:hypothetical protein